MASPPDDLDDLFARARAADAAAPDFELQTDFDPEPEPFDPQEELAAQRRRARWRTRASAVLAFLVLGAGWFQRDELAYAFEAETPLDLGNFDQAVRKGTPPAARFEHNRYARYEKGLLVEEREGAPGVYYFFEPSTNLVVVTRRALPEKAGHNVPINEAYIPLFMGKWVLPDDLTATFGAQGRLLRADLAPRRFRLVTDYYRSTLKLDERRPGEPVWILEDGMAPSGHSFVLGLFAAALAVVALSTTLTVKAHRDARRFAEAVSDLERPR